MKKSEWSDNELEQLLRQMPKVQDHRDPRDIYQSLSLKAKKRKAPVWIVPSVASVAAVLLLFLLAPQVWQGNIQDKATEEKSVAVEDRSKNTEMAKVDPNKDSGKASLSQDISIMATEFETAIYKEDIIDQEVITYMIPDQNAQILVPVSVLVPKENKSWAELYQTNSESLSEAQWGLSDFYPLNATLSMIDEKTMNVDVPEGHVYGSGSANEILFTSTMDEILFRHENLQKITFSTNGVPGIMLGNTGQLMELNKPTLKKRAYFLFNPNNQNMPFIVPGIDTFTDIDTALESMRTENAINGFKPSIPSDFVYKVDASSSEQLILTFDTNVQLTNDAKNIYAIEAILLTAKEFGYEKVKFVNAPITQIGRFNLENEVNVPVAPNKVFLQ